MSDYMRTPAYKARTQRRRGAYWKALLEIVSVMAGAVVVALAFLSLFALMLFLLPGCTAMSYEQQRQLAAQAEGCYCSGKGCREITGAAGKAAVAAAEDESFAVTKVERLER